MNRPTVQSLYRLLVSILQNVYTVSNVISEEKAPIKKRRVNMRIILKWIFKKLTINLKIILMFISKIGMFMLYFVGLINLRIREWRKNSWSGEELCFYQCWLSPAELVHLREFLRELINRVCTRIIVVRFQRRKLQCPETGEGKVRIMHSVYVIINCQ